MPGLAWGYGRLCSPASRHQVRSRAACRPSRLVQARGLRARRSRYRVGGYRGERPVHGRRRRPAQPDRRYSRQHQRRTYGFAAWSSAAGCWPGRRLPRHDCCATAAPTRAVAPTRFSSGKRSAPPVSTPSNCSPRLLACSPQSPQAPDRSFRSISAGRSLDSRSPRRSDSPAGSSSRRRLPAGRGWLNGRPRAIAIIPSGKAAAAAATTRSGRYRVHASSGVRLPARSPESDTGCSVSGRCGPRAGDARQIVARVR